jgi:hypothetical protein
MKVFLVVVIIFYLRKIDKYCDIHMTIRKELIDELLKEYSNLQDIFGEG